jgi:hypothetical protein
MVNLVKAGMSALRGAGRALSQQPLKGLLDIRIADSNVLLPNGGKGKGGDEYKLLIGPWWQYTRQSREGFLYAIFDVLYGELENVRIWPSFEDRISCDLISYPWHIVCAKGKKQVQAVRLDC